MGYRSDVRLVLVFPNAERRAEFDNRYKLESQDWDSNTIAFWEQTDGGGDSDRWAARDEPRNHTIYGRKNEAFTVITDGGSITKVWDDIKWYPGYKEIMFAERMQEMCLECKGAWVFGRIGEEDDDITTDTETFDAETDEEKQYWTANGMFDGDDYLRMRRYHEFPDH